MRLYPDNWSEIARQVKDRAGWRCERCGHPHDPASGHMLTVAHLDHRFGEQRWNLAALCQRCHLRYEHKFHWEQGWLWKHSRWLVPHLRGYRRYVERQWHVSGVACCKRLDYLRQAWVFDFHCRACGWRGALHVPTETGERHCPHCGAAYRLRLTAGWPLLFAGAEAALVSEREAKIARR